MTIEIIPNHVAVLVPSVRKAAEHLRQFNFHIGKEEIWDGEGTKEIYVEREKSNSVLLMEPIKSGAYQHAMEKRGPGLHHFAITVSHIESYLESLVGSGWLLHPISIRTMKKGHTAYLARPGFPALIEVRESNQLINRRLFVEEVSIPLDQSLRGLVKHIGLSNILVPSSASIKMTMGGCSVALGDLL